MKWIPLGFIVFFLCIQVYGVFFFFYQSFWGDVIMRFRARMYTLMALYGLVFSSWLGYEVFKTTLGMK